MNRNESFAELFLVKPGEFTATPKHPWVFLKRKNRWVYADSTFYNERDQRTLKALIEFDAKGDKVKKTNPTMWRMCFPIGAPA